MPVTVNSKTILLNERILFKEGQTIMIEDKIPIRMSANSESSEKIGLEGAGNVFDLSINGMSASSFDRITSGSGSWKGEPFEYIIHSIFVGALGGVKIYEVSITAYQI